MTPRWLCRPCDMLCLDQQHYGRHRDGDHSPTTDDEWERYRRPWIGYVEVDRGGELKYER